MALVYRPGDPAPTVVAKGRGWLAEEIQRRAREAGVYVHPAPELVALLMPLDLDERIPEALYVAVAEVLAWMYGLEQGEGGAPDPGHVTPGPDPSLVGSGQSALS